MRPQTSPLLTLVTVVIAGAILFLIVCAGVYLIVNPFRAAPTTTAAANQPTVVVTQVVVITTTPAPTKAITPTGRPSPTNTALST
ncbi:MAG TPA: hypothetical protein VFD70_21125, partial [Anaerolineae bacterium]|nr:hypothetical protein [Anaerolineae bacterium]